MSWKIKCNKCGETYPKSDWRWRCRCRGTLSISFDYSGQTYSGLLAGGERRGMKKFSNFLPSSDSLVRGVGGTNIVREREGEISKYYKLEYLNPGGSFKDRGAYVSVLEIDRLEKESLVVDSSGNSAISFALMGRASRLNVHAFVPDHSPEGKKDLLRVLGAKLHEIKGERSDVNKVAIQESEELGPYVGHWWNPYFLEGVKTIAFEMNEQIRDIDYVICPIGSGTILLGVYKGFRELLSLQEIEEMPKLIGVQACGYTSVSEELGVERDCEKTKLADGIAIGSPPRKEEIANAIKDTGGTCVIVNKREIRKSCEKLLKSGFVIEPTSSVSEAGLQEAREKDIIKEGNVALPLTGSGLKVIDKLREIALSGNHDENSETIERERFCSRF